MKRNLCALRATACGLFKSIARSRFALRVLGISLAMTLAGCGVFSTSSAVSKKSGHDDAAISPETMIILPAPSNKDGAVLGAKKFGLMALFSSLAYSRHLPEGPARKDCLSTAKSHPITAIDPPTTTLINGEAVPLPRWQLWNNALGCVAEGGLYFETYVFGTQTSTPRQIKSAVIAFRGTESSATDWWNDFEVAILGLDPEEYRLAREKVKLAIEQLRSGNDKLKVYLTGHSLGGGLAQQIAYIEKNTAAIVFDTSPVTNWSYLSRKGLITKGREDPEITRVSENKEALSYVRWVTSRLNFMRFQRSDYLFFFNKTKNPAKAHDMSILTCNFALRVKDEDDKFHYRPEMATNVLNLQPIPDGEVPCPREDFDDVWRKSFPVPAKS